MVKIKIYFSLTEELITLNIEKYFYSFRAPELLNYLINIRKISHFNILLEDGRKFSKNKFKKFEKVLEEEYKNSSTLSLILLSSESGLKQTNEDLLLRLFNEKMSKVTENQILLNNLNNVFKFIFRSVNDIEKLENQTKIIQIIESFYKKTISKVNNKILKIENDYLDLKKQCNNLNKIDIKSQLEELKSTALNFDELKEENIKNALNDFRKTFLLFEGKFSNLKEIYNGISVQRNSNETENTFKFLEKNEKMFTFFKKVYETFKSNDLKKILESFTISKIKLLTFI